MLQDDKTRELAATMVNALNSSTDSMEVRPRTIQCVNELRASTTHHRVCQ